MFLFQLLEGFIDEFFDQNPISQMGLIITKNKRAEKISELAGNPRKHIKVCEACHFSEECYVVGHDSLHVRFRLFYLLPWQAMTSTIYPLPALAPLPHAVAVNCDRLCGLVVRVPGYRSRGPGFDRTGSMNS
jgi:hypothetical protein